MARQPKSDPAAAIPEPVTAGGPPEAEAGGILTIDLAAIFDNYRSLAVRVMPTECAAVVKGDAYGCGIDQVTATLSRAGCKTFFVAHLDEARRVRALAPEAVIYVLNGYTSGTGPAFAEALRAAGDQFIGRACRVGSVCRRERLARRRRTARRH